MLNNILGKSLILGLLSIAGGACSSGGEIMPVEMPTPASPTAAAILESFVNEGEAARLLGDTLVLPTNVPAGLSRHRGGEVAETEPGIVGVTFWYSSSGSPADEDTSIVALGVTQWTEKPEPVVDYDEVVDILGTNVMIHGRLDAAGQVVFADWSIEGLAFEVFAVGREGVSSEVLRADVLSVVQSMIDQL